MNEAANRHSAAALGLRVLAALLVVAASLLIKDLVLDRPSGSTTTAGSRLIEWTVDSELIGEQLPVSVVIPPGARDGRRSLLVFLHGRGDDEGSYLNEAMYAALSKQGGRAPVVAFPRGDPDSYWHDRDAGAWGSYVLDELIPKLIARFDIEPERIAIGGISMGGFGAFDIARLQPGRFCAVGGHSPAVWESASEVASGAFDDEQDFNAHDVIALVGPPTSPLAGKRFWVDAGDEDPFASADQALATALERGGAKGRFYAGEGGHETGYWNSNWRRYMHFYARSLKKCQQRASVDKPPDATSSRGGTKPGGGSGSGGSGKAGKASGGVGPGAGGGA